MACQLSEGHHQGIGEGHWNQVEVLHWGDRRQWSKLGHDKEESEADIKKEHQEKRNLSEQHKHNPNFRHQQKPTDAQTPLTAFLSSPDGATGTSDFISPFTSA